MIPVQFADASGADQLNALLDGRIPFQGIAETLDCRFEAFSEGYACFTGRPSERVYNPIGTVQGGYAATLLDFAAALAVHSLLKPNQCYTTLEIKIAFHKPMTAATGPVRAEGRVVQMGRRAAFSESTLKDEAGRLYASATSTCIVTER